MTLRSRPNDLAFIVRSHAPENLNKIVRVVERAPDWDGTPAWIVRSEGSPLTGFDRLTLWPSPAMVCRAPDSALRPIRPGPLEADAPPATVERTAPCSA